ncbi:MAG: ferritin family protein [Spirochaetota bacterium]
MNQDTNHDTIETIINFALKMEEEAVQFYKKLQVTAHFNRRRKVVFSDFEKIEHKHIEQLKNFQKEDSAKEPAFKIRDLKISSYVVEGELSEDMSYPDVLLLGFKKEGATLDLYLRLSEKAPSKELQELFYHMATEEAAHKYFFEAIYDNEIQKEN